MVYYFKSVTRVTKLLKALRTAVKLILKKGGVSVALIAVLMATLGAPVEAAQNGPKLLNYQARVTDSSGAPVPDGSLDIEILIHDAASGGSCLYALRGTCGTPTAKTVTVTNGVFSTVIGDTVAGDNALPDGIFDADATYLGLAIEADAEMTPRKRITAAAYAFNADRLDDMDTTTTGAASSVVATDSSGNLTLNGGNVTVDTNTMFVDAANNRVLLGSTTAVAGARLEIINNANNTTQAYVVNQNTGTSAAAGYGLLNDAGTYGFFGVYGANYAAIPAYANRNVWETSGAGIGLNATVGGDIRFYGNTTERMRIENGGNVGIGDSSPAAMLTVGSGDLFQVNSSGAIAAATGITSSGTISFTGSAMNFGDGSGADIITLGSTTRFLAPAHAANAGLRLPTNAGAPSGVTGTQEGDIVWDSTGNALYVYDGSAFVSAAGVTGTGSAGHISYWSSSTAQTYDSNGNFFWDATNNRLGIGTVSPAFPLDIQSGTHTQIVLGATGNAGSINFRRPGDGNNTANLGYSSGGIFRINEGSGAGEIRIFTNSGKTTWYDFTETTNIMTVDHANNRVGIGTLSPGAPLTVNGAIRGYNSANGYGEINLENTASGTFDGFQFRKDTSTLWSAKSVSSGNDLAVFVDNTSSRGIYIKTGGNVGVGTTSPTQRLHVSTTGDTQVLIEKTGAGYASTCVGGGALNIVDNGTSMFQLFPNYCNSKAMIVLGSPSRDGGFDLYNYRSLYGDSAYNFVMTTKAAGASAADRFVVTGNADTATAYFTNVNFGIGDTSPAALFTVGSGDLFQVNSSGAIAAATGITSSGTISFTDNVTLGASAADTLTVNGVLQGASPLVFEGATADDFETTFAMTDPTADRTITFQNASGTVAFLSDVTGITGTGSAGHMSYWSGATSQTYDADGNFVWDATNNRLGIRAATPLAKLHIGDASSSSDLFMGTGSAESGSNTFLQVKRTADTSGNVELDTFLSGGAATGGHLLINSKYLSGGNDNIYNVSIGTTVTDSLLNVGYNGTFQVDKTGNLVKIRNVAYSWPASNAGGILTNNGSGTLSWTSGVTNKVSYWSSSSTLSTDTEFDYDATNNRLAIGGVSPSVTLLLKSASENPAVELQGTTVPDFTGVGFGPNVTTTTTGRIAQAGLAHGGLAFLGFTAATDTVAAVSFIGHLGSTSNTQPAIRFIGYKHNGGTSRQALSSSEKVLAVANASTEVLTVLGSGYVGIGTASPVAMLDVRGTSYIYGTPPTDYLGQLHLYNSAASLPTYSNTDNDGLGLRYTKNSSDNWLGTADFVSTVKNSNGTDGGSQMRFFTQPRAASGALERLRIDRDGNVGIGDSSPAAMLTVGSGDLFQINSSGAIAAATGITSSGTISFTGSTMNFGDGSGADIITLGSTTRFLAPAHANNAGLRLPTNAGAPSGVTGTQEGDVVWDSTGNALYVYDGSAFVSTGISGTGSAGHMSYWSGASSQTYDADGNFFWDATNNRLGIGTATPTAKLHVEQNYNGATYVRAYNSDTTASGSTQAGFTANAGTTGDSAAVMYISPTTAAGLGDYAGHMVLRTGGGTASDVDLVIGTIGNGSSTGNDQIRFFTGATYSSTTTRMVIDKSTIWMKADVGIGVEAPSARLDVEGTGAAMLELNRTATSPGLWRALITSNPVSGTIGSGSLTWVSSTADTDFGVRAGNSGDPQFLVRSTGRIGMGTIDPLHQLHVVHTLPNPGGSTTETASHIDITTQGANNSLPEGLRVSLKPGFTGTRGTIALSGRNTVAGTATVDLLGGQGNLGIVGVSSATTTAINYGTVGAASNGDTSIGLYGYAQTAKASATNIGVVGVARNTGVSSLQIGGYFSLNSTNPTFASAALIADNGAETSPLFLARDNGTTVFSIIDGGNVGVGDTSPAALFTVGSGDLFQVNSSGAIAAATGITSSGTISFTGSTMNFGDGSGADIITLGSTTRFLAPAHANNAGLRLPTNAGAPSGVTGTQEGDIVWDSTGNALYVYDGAAFVSAAGVTGSGSSGHVSYWNGTSSQTYDADGNFFWDATNNRLGIGDATPGSALEVSSGTNVSVAMPYNLAGVTSEGGVLALSRSDDGAYNAFLGVSENPNDDLVLVSASGGSHLRLAGDGSGTGVGIGFLGDFGTIANVFGNARPTYDVTILGNGTLVAQGNVSGDAQFKAVNGNKQVFLNNPIASVTEGGTIGLSRPDDAQMTLILGGAEAPNDDAVIYSPSGESQLRFVANVSTATTPAFAFYTQQTAASAFGNARISNPPLSILGHGGVVITEPSLADTQQALLVTATLPSGAATINEAVELNVTTVGAGSGGQVGQTINLLHGYTGGANTMGLYAYNQSRTTETSSPLIYSRAAAVGVYGFSRPSSGTAGNRTGGYFQADSGTSNNVGVQGNAWAETSMTGAAYGVIGTVFPNAVGVGPAYAGYFKADNYSGFTITSGAALVADNGAAAIDIFRALDNGSAVLTVADGGGVTMTSTLAVQGVASLQANTNLGDGSGTDIVTIGSTTRLLAPAHANNAGLRLPINAGAPSGVTGTQEGDIVWDSTGNALYVYDGSAFVSPTGLSGSGSAGHMSYWSGASSQTYDADGNFYWDATNNRLGIGTTAPGTMLDVRGTSYIAGAPPTNFLGQVHIYDTAASLPTYSNTDYDGLGLRYTKNSADNYLGTADFVSTVTNSNGTSGGSQMRFFTQPRAASGPIERLRIDRDGRVGIGTTTPGSGTGIDTLLHVYGTGTGTSGRTEVRVQNTQADSAAAFTLVGGSGKSMSAQVSGASYVGGENASFATFGGINLQFVPDGEVATGGTSSILFYAGGWQTSNERMRITPSGNVGIGDTSPAALFTVGSGDLFQVNSSGNLTSPNDVTWTLGGGVNGLNIDSNTLSVDATNNRIGIGTAAPTAQVDVVSATNAQLTVRVDDPGDNGYSTIVLADGGGGGGDATFSLSLDGVNQGSFGSAGGGITFQSNGDGDYYFLSNGQTRMTILNGGNVGVGDDTPDAMFSVGSTSQFQVNSSGAIAAATGITSSGTISFTDSVTLGASAADTLTVNGVLQGASPLVFEGATADGFETTFAITDPTAARTVTFQNASGTVAYLSDVTGLNAFVQGGNSFSATAVLGTNDTNALEFETDGTTRASISSAGTLTLNHDLTFAAGGGAAYITSADNESLIFNVGTTGGEVAFNIPGNGRFYLSSATNEIEINTTPGETSVIDVNGEGTTRLRMSNDWSSAYHTEILTDASIFAEFTTLDGTDLANGTGGGSTTLILDDTTGFNAGNYVLVNSTYAKIVSVDSGTNLTISPALTWSDNAAVTEVYVPEIGGNNITSTLTQRFGRGYFIDGIVTGNGTTRYSDNRIESSGTLFVNTGSQAGIYVYGTGNITKTLGSEEDAIFVAYGTASNSDGNLVYGTQTEVNNAPTALANTVIAQRVAVTGAGTLANTVYGLYADVNTSNANDTQYSGVFMNGNFGIGDDTPDALFSVGSTSQFQVNSSGAIAAATGITSSGTVSLTGNTTVGDAITDSITINGAIQGTNALVFDGSTDDTNETTFVITDPSADRTFTFKDESGTVAFLTDISAFALTDNTANAYDLQEGTNNYININTTNASENISFGNATTNPSFNFLGTGALGIAADVNLTSNDDQTITFSTADATNSPMIQMFSGGSSNGDRMVIAHSSAFNTWGLQYRDSSDDFAFLAGGAETMLVTLSASTPLSFEGSSDDGIYTNFTFTNPTTSSKTMTFQDLTGVVALQSASTLTSNGILFAGSTGLITQDNTNFVWDDSSNRLGIGDSTPDLPIDFESTATGNIMKLTADSMTTGTGFEISANAMTAGTALLVTSTSTANTTNGVFPGNFISAAHTATYATASGTWNNSSGLISAVRDLSVNASGATVNVTNPVMWIIDSNGSTLGTMNDSADVARFEKQGSANTGAVLNLAHDNSSGVLIRANSNGTFTDTKAFVVTSTVNGPWVGIGTDSPSSNVDITGTEQNVAIRLNSAAASNRRPNVQFEQNGTATFSIGTDGGDSDKFKISAGSFLVGTTVMTITSSTLTEINTTDVDINGNLRVNLDAAPSGNYAVCHTTNGGATDQELYDCNGVVNNDYAEMYPVAADVEYGHIVKPGTEYVLSTLGNSVPRLIKSSGAYDGSVIGIAVDNYSDFSSIGYEFLETETYKPLALKGRVPVKVNMEGGAISPGDAIVPSSVPGIGMKANRAGMIVGRALQSWSGPGEGTVFVYVQTEYWLGATVTANGTVTTLEGPMEFNDDVAFTKNGAVMALASDTPGNTFVMKIPQLASGNCSSGAAEGLVFQNDAGVQVGHACINGAGTQLRWYARAFQATSTDVAENYNARQGENLGAGELVMVDPLSNEPFTVARAHRAAGNTVLGIISTDPGILLSGIAEDLSRIDAVRPVAVALSGRVPTKVSTENGPIKMGDPLALSSTPGVAAKAVQNGMIVGFALAPYNGQGVGTIEVFVNLGWWNGAEVTSNNVASQLTAPQTTSLQIYQDLNFGGYGINNIREIRGTAWSIGADGALVAKSVAAEQFIVKKTDQSVSMEKISVAAGTQTLVITNPAMKATSEVFLSWHGNPGSFAWITDRADGNFTLRLASPIMTTTDVTYWIVGVEDLRSVTATSPAETASQPVAAPTTSDPLPPAESTQPTEPATTTEPTEPATTTTPTEPAEIIVQEPVAAAPTTPAPAPAPEPVSEPVTDPAPVTEPASEPTPEPSPEPVPEPEPAPAPEPVQEPAP